MKLNYQKESSAAGIVLTAFIMRQGKRTVTEEHTAVIMGIITIRRNDKGVCHMKEDNHKL